ncbi:preprotein translocase subunit SecG [Camelimonas abortus]|uniref:Protein-export membrane protein SecG n=1 Tax=Camelimonas abortus TaxID=1017184 RepID=A0ABV7LH92_9HYPH
MQTVLIVIHLLIVLALVGVVLLQRSEGGGLGMGGGSGVSGLMTGRGQANALTRLTAILAGLFFITSLGLTVLATVSRDRGSVLDRALPSQTAPAGAPAAPAGGGVLEQLQQLQNQAPAAPAAPAVPSAPVAPAPAAPQAPAQQN